MRLLHLPLIAVCTLVGCVGSDKGFYDDISPTPITVNDPFGTDRDRLYRAKKYGENPVTAPHNVGYGEQYWPATAEVDLSEIASFDMAYLPDGALMLKMPGNPFDHHVQVFLIGFTEEGKPGTLHSRRFHYDLDGGCYEEMVGEEWVAHHAHEGGAPNELDVGRICAPQTIVGSIVAISLKPNADAQRPAARTEVRLLVYSDGEHRWARVPLPPKEMVDPVPPELSRWH